MFRRPKRPLIPAPVHPLQDTRSEDAAALFETRIAELQAVTVRLQVEVDRLTQHNEGAFGDSA